MILTFRSLVFLWRSLNSNMIHVLITQTSGGRTGHILKDLLTAFCLHFLKGWGILYDDSWYGKHNKKNVHDNHLDMFNLTGSLLVKKYLPNQDSSLPVYTFKKTSYNGMSLETLNELIKFAENAENDCGNVIIRLIDATRVLPNQLYNWGFKEEFTTFSLHLRSLFLDSHTHSCEHKPFKETGSDTLKITVHIRKGDCFNRVMHGFDHRDITYYKTVMTNLYEIYGKEKAVVFNVISETWPGYDEKDVRDLQNMFVSENCNVNVYLELCLYEYFRECIDSDIMVVTNGQGSFSDLCILYTKKDTKIVVCKEYRQFDFVDDMGGKFIFCDKKGNFD